MRIITCFGDRTCGTFLGFSDEDNSVSRTDNFVTVFNSVTSLPILPYHCVLHYFLKVKCNEIWTIFLLSKNLHKMVSYTNMKQSQLLKISFVRPAAPKTRKTDDFRELHENEPEMVALGWKQNYRYL